MKHIPTIDTHTLQVIAANARRDDEIGTASLNLLGEAVNRLGDAATTGTLDATRIAFLAEVADAAASPELASRSRSLLVRDADAKRNAIVNKVLKV